MKNIIVIFLMLAYTSPLFSQNKGEQIKQIENKIDSLESELEAYKRQLKILKIGNRSFLSKNGINYNDEYVKKIIDNMGPLVFANNDGVWQVHCINTVKNAYLIIPMQDLYGLDKWSEFYSIKNDKKYFTNRKPVLVNAICKSFLNNVTLEGDEIRRSGDRGVISGYLSNCGNKEVHSLSVEIILYDFNDIEVQKLVVDILDGEKLSIGDVKRFETFFNINDKVSYLFKFKCRLL